VEEGRCRVTDEDAVDLYMRARLEGTRYDLVDADGFGTGQPHIAEAWWAVRKGGLLYACATDSCTTAGHNPHKATSGYAAVAHYYPSCNEQGLRLLLGAAWREAAARNLEAAPVFAYFHRPSSSLRVMLRLVNAKRPPARAYDSLSYVGRCSACGQLWRVPLTGLGNASGASSLCACGAGASAVTISGPMWTGPMHDADYVRQMADEARKREWADAAELLDRMAEEAVAEKGGALLFYHLGEVQRALARRGIGLPPLARLIELLEGAGFSASHSHIERKALKTNATLEQVVDLVGASSPHEDSSEVEAEGAGARAES
jgi:tRNA (guanine26-N2/guanine27-N2)-dimethyltransferase